MRGVEIAEGAEGRNAVAGGADEVVENVQIVTALLQNHRAGALAVAPISAYEGMRLVPIADVFHRVDVDHVPDLARLNDVFDRPVKGGVAQDVTDRHFAVQPSRRVADGDAVFRRRRDRLFQDEVVSPLQPRQRMADVLLILRRHDEDVRQLFSRKHLFGAFKTHFGRHVQIFRRHFQFPFVDVRDRRHLHPFGVNFLVLRVCIKAPGTQPRYRNRRHFFSPDFVMSFFPRRISAPRISVPGTSGTALPALSRPSFFTHLF